MNQMPSFPFKRPWNTSRNMSCVCCHQLHLFSLTNIVWSCFVSTLWPSFRKSFLFHLHWSGLLRMQAQSEVCHKRFTLFIIRDSITLCVCGLEDHKFLNLDTRLLQPIWISSCFYFKLQHSNCVTHMILCRYYVDDHPSPYQFRFFVSELPMVCFQMRTQCLLTLKMDWLSQKRLLSTKYWILQTCSTYKQICWKKKIILVLYPICSLLRLSKVVRP